MKVEIARQDGSVGIYVDGEYVACIVCDGEESLNVCEIKNLFTFLGIKYDVINK